VGRQVQDQRGLTVVEAVIAICIMSILISIVVPKYQRLAREAREAALKTGLMNIRTSIALFKMLNNRYPKDFAEMTEKNIMLPARLGNDPFTGSFFSRKYLMLQVHDGQGRYLDSFGNPFVYDGRQGVVKSTTRDYESW